MASAAIATPPITWRIHGNIGAGKTSVMKSLAAAWSFRPAILNGKSIRCYFEDTAAWAIWLDRFYKAKEPRTEAPRVELCVMGHYLDVTRKIMEENESAVDPANMVHIVERGPDSVRDIFLPLNKPKKNDALDHMYPILDAVFFDPEATDIPWNTARDIYLRVSPELCLKRIQKRGRHCETAEGANISLEFLQTLHAMHDEMYMGRDDVYVIDVPDDPETILRRFTPDHIARRLWTDMNIQ